MEYAQITTQLLSILFIVAVVAGLLDTLAGGGGLIALPALILSGVGPLAALGTNKLQGSMGTATATFLMIKNKRVKWHDVKNIMLFAFIGATIGSIAIQFVNPEILNYVIPVVISFIGVYFLISPTPSEEQAKPKLSQRSYNNIVVPAIGCYDGFFGPGTGSFFALAGISLRGYGIIKSTAIAKTLNFSTNIASLIIFLFAGKIVWTIGVVMMFGQVIGAWLGSHCLFSINPKLLRMLVVIMCFGMLIKYSYDMGWLLAR
ncbi:TSUP family transporter [Colwellia sp. KU-HH00111]|uniref:TSUP family transporter n=1 Tax=Colwellia sp. KU-HH00111 TaxID=3127652 RepID=UPI003104460B